MCAFLSKKSHLEDIDLSNNRVEPKLFLPLLEALSKNHQLKHINLSWNLFFEKARGPQIGTYCKEEKLVFGVADQPIDFEAEKLKMRSS